MWYNTGMKLSERQVHFIVPAFSAVLAVVTFLIACQTTFPWCDELVLTDKPANWAICGSYTGCVWPQTYNLLYPIALSLGFRLFGVSHATVCGVTILAAFLASCAILAAARRRGLLKDLSGQLLFVALFWCAGNLPQIFANGRLDSMTLLFTVLFADALLPDTDRSPRTSLILTAGWGFALMLTSVYMLPLMFVLGLFSLATCRPDERRGLVRRGFACAAAFAIAYVVMMGFYFYTREAIRFAGFYLYFNTITGEAVGSLASRIVKGYSGNVWVQGLMAALLIVAAFTRDRKSMLWSGFLVAIPLLMTVMGRYESYYSWAFLVPVSLMLAIMLSRRFPAWVPTTLAVGVLAYGGWSRACACRHHEGDRFRRDRAERFVSDHSELFPSEADVVVADDVYGDSTFYYPIQKRGCHLWYRGERTLKDPSDREKFNQGLSMLVKEPKRRDEILNAVMTFQRCMPTLPSAATFVFPSAKSYEKVSPLLRERGYAPTGVAVEEDGIRCEQWRQ